MDKALYLMRPRLLSMSFDADLSFLRYRRYFEHTKIRTPTITMSSTNLRIAIIKNISITNMYPPFSSLQPSDWLEKYKVNPYICQANSDSSFVADRLRRIHFLCPRFSSQYVLLFIRSFNSINIVSTIRKANWPASHIPRGILHLGCSENMHTSTAPIWR